MIKVRHTGRLYLGRVAVRDRFVKEAARYNLPLQIRYDNHCMIIQPYEIEERTVGRSEKPVADQFSNDKHYLIYFVWRPSERFKQSSLFVEGVK